MQVILQNYWGWVNKNLHLKWIILLISLILLPIFSQAAEKAQPLEAVIEHARQMELGEKKAWLNLLHYKSTLLGPRESQIDDVGFFLAPNGEHDAQAELDASLRGFFSINASAHPRCLYPARFHWLNAQLDFAEQLPPMNCAPFNTWKEKFQAEQVTLLFPSMHLENPASMFGHTFIRFDRADKNHLLSYTLSYAASYDESDPMLVYSWKGVTGGYPGKFFIRAYYETLQVYSDIEQRDIWEYQLNLNQSEIDQLIRHLWEVKGVHFDYFFFRENCSYRLLALLDVARENINMSIDSHPLYAVPVDTVRDVDEVGLIQQRKYRPSTHNKISQMIAQMDNEASNAAIAMVEDDKTTIEKIVEPFSINQQAKILLLADELLNQNKILSAAQKNRQFDILSARSDLAVKPQEIEFKYSSTPPELSHQTARWNIAAGEQKINDFEKQSFYELGLRPVFHDLLDASKGFINGASISVLETELRWYQQQQKLKLQSLNFFSLESILPVKPWTSRVSKKISFIVKQRNIDVSEQVLEFESQFSMGYAAEVKSALVYALAKVQLEYATELDKNHGLYLGANIGGLWAFNAGELTGQTEINYQNLQQISGEEGDIQVLNLGIQFNLYKEHALRFEYENINYDLFDVDEARLSYLMYF